MRKKKNDTKGCYLESKAVKGKYNGININNKYQYQKKTTKLSQHLSKAFECPQGVCIKQTSSIIMEFLTRPSRTGSPSRVKDTRSLLAGELAF